MSLGENLYSTTDNRVEALPKEKLDSMFFRVPTAQRHSRNKSSTMGGYGALAMKSVPQSPDVKNLKYWNVPNQRYDMIVL